MSYLSFAREMLGNLFKPPATSQYPFQPRKVYEADRGKVVNDINNCIFCGMCMRNCPSDAITVDRNARTWKINRFACVQCKECVTNCPKKCLTMENLYTIPDVVKVVDTFDIPKKAPKKMRKYVFNVGIILWNILSIVITIAPIIGIFFRKFLALSEN